VANKVANKVANNSDKSGDDLFNECLDKRRNKEEAKIAFGKIHLKKYFFCYRYDHIIIVT